MVGYICDVSATWHALESLDECKSLKELYHLRPSDLHPKKEEGFFLREAQGRKKIKKLLSIETQKIGTETSDKITNIIEWVYLGI